MKIVVLGKGKSGTSALLQMIGNAFPECRSIHGGLKAHARGRTRSDADRDANIAAKFTHNDAKGRTFDVIAEHVAREGYDKKIWVARDPRDNAVSDALYRWRRRHGRSQRQFRACLDAVEKKEKDPRSVAFNEINRFTGDPGGPLTLDEMLAVEFTRYRRMCQFIRGLGDDWFIFKYEDLVDGNLGALSAYLGREVRAGGELAGEDRVKARTKSYGDWRNWFLAEDVVLFEPIFSDYMGLVGYDATDWALPDDPRIDPALASRYMRRIASEPGVSALHILRRRLRRLLAAGVRRYRPRPG
jgi:hypothetical protein